MCAKCIVSVHVLIAQHIVCSVPPALCRMFQPTLFLIFLVGQSSAIQDEVPLTCKTKNRGNKRFCRK